MKRLWIMMLVAVVGLTALAFSSQAESTSIKGDYVEVRTASVFAGACHYNGEVTTAGREALMVWNVTSGKWRGVDLAGTRAIAVVNSEENLSNVQAGRRAEIIVDKSATHEQAVAIIEVLKSRYETALGEIVSVRTAPINFKHDGTSYEITSTEAALNVEAMPNDLCCRMPNLVWYSPLVPLGQRKVGYTVKALYSGNAVGEGWERAGENSAFYGSFSL
jgi:Protein of unknown function (DUF1326)